MQSSGFGPGVSSRGGPTTLAGRFHFLDGVMANKTFEHRFADDGSVTFRMVSFAANAPVGHMTIHLAYDATPDVERHEFFENFLPDEHGRPRSGRAVAPAAVSAVLACLDASTDRDRFLRAIEQYRQATKYWRQGWETFAVIHLWMAVEAITKVALRRAIKIEAVGNEDELVRKWDLADKRALDGEARRRLVFHGDATCEAETRKASDGFEHGFLPFDEINQLAVRVRDRAAQHVRNTPPPASRGCR
jgi:hypothetical protein